MTNQILVLLLCASCLYAQTDPDTTRIRTVLSKAVVVSSVRAAPEAPITHATVDSATLSRTMVGQDAQFVLEQTVPGIVAYSESGTGFSNYGSFRLRGIDQTRVNVTLNGVPLNDMIDQGVFFSNITDLLNGMHSVQVQRGVGTSANGTASFAGSVSIESDMPMPRKPGAIMQLTSGSYNLLRGSATVNSGDLGNGIAASVKLGAFTTQGYRYNTASTGYNGMAGISAVQGSEIFRFLAVGGTIGNQLAYLPVPKPLADIDPRTNVNDSNDHDNFGQYLMQAEWTHAFDDKTASSVMVYAGGAGGDYYTGFADAAGNLTQINYPLENRHYGVLGTLSLWDVLPNVSVTGGVHTYIFTRRNWETVVPFDNRPYYDDSTTKRELAAFVKAAWTIGSTDDYPQATLQADLQIRYARLDFRPDMRTVPQDTKIPAHTWLFVNPRVGLNLQLSDHVGVYTSVGSTGREPTRFDLLGGTQITEANLPTLLQPNTVRPEYVVDAELGTRLTGRLLSALPNISLNLNGFYMKFTDEIAPVGEYIDQYFVQLRTNVASSSRYGVEADLRWELRSSLTLSVNATVMKSNIKNVYLASAQKTVSNVEAVLTPHVQGTAQLQWDPADWLGFDVGLRTVSSSFLELTNAPNLMLDGFTIADAALRLNYRTIQLGIRVNNIGNRQYTTNGGVDYSKGQPVPTVFMQAGRNLWVYTTIAL